MKHFKKKYLLLAITLAITSVFTSIQPLTANAQKVVGAVIDVNSFQADVKKIVNPDVDDTWDYTDTVIKHIIFEVNNDEVSDTVLDHSNKIQSPVKSPYVSFDEVTGTLKIWTNYDRFTIQNETAGAPMFNKLSALETIEGFDLLDLSGADLTDMFRGTTSLRQLSTPKVEGLVYLPVALYDEEGYCYIFLNSSIPKGTVLSLDYKPTTGCAILPQGCDFCSDAKFLVNEASDDYTAEDTEIKHIKFVCNQTDFTNYVPFDRNNYLYGNASRHNIFAKFENGTLTIATPYPRMVTDTEVPLMFYQMKALEDIEGLVWNNDISIFRYVFYNDTALKSVDLSTLAITPNTNSGIQWEDGNFYGCSSLETIVTPKSYDNENSIELPATYYYNNANNIFATEVSNQLQDFRPMESVKRNGTENNMYYCLQGDVNATFIRTDLSKHESNYFSSETYLNELKDYCSTALQNSNLYSTNIWVSSASDILSIFNRRRVEDAFIGAPTANSTIYTLIDKSSYSYEITDIQCNGLSDYDGSSYYRYVCNYKIKDTNYTGSMNVYVGEIPNYFGDVAGHWSSNWYDLSKIITFYEPMIDFNSHLVNLNMSNNGGNTLDNFFIPLTDATESSAKEETTSVFEQIRNFHSDYSYEVLNETLSDIYYLDIGNTDINAFKNMLTVKDDASDAIYELWSDDYTDYPIYIDDQNRPYYKVDTGVKKESVNVSESNLDDTTLDAIESSVEDATDISSKVYDITYSVVTEDTNGNVVSSETVTDLSDDSASADVAKVYIKLDNYSADDGFTRVITHIHNGTNDTYTYTDNLTDTDMTHYTIEDGYAVLNMSTFSPVVVTTYKSAVKTPANTPTNTTTGDTGSTSGTTASQTSSTTTTQNTSDTNTTQTGDNTNSETTTTPEDNSGSKTDTTSNTTSNTTNSTSSDTSANTSTDTTDTISQTTTTNTTDDTDTTDNNDTKPNDTVSDNSQSQTQSSDETVSNKDATDDTKDTVVTTSSNSNLTEENDNCDKKDSDITTSSDSSDVEDEEIADTDSSNKNIVNSSHTDRSYDSRVIIIISLILLLLIIILILLIRKKKSNNE